MMADVGDPAYLAEERDGGWVVVDGEGRVVCSCGAAPNARHYETLLNEAHRRGFRAGFRAAKSAGTG